MTTRDPIPSDGGDEQLRRQMLDALADAIDNEDTYFIIELTANQSLLRPFEIAEYMDVKRRHTEDPVASRRWEDGLRTYLNQLQGQEFPAEEIDVINKIISTLEFEHIASSTDMADISDTVTASDDEEEKVEDEDYDWENDKFAIYMDGEEIERIRNLPIFKQAEELAAGSRYRAPDLNAAIKYIESNVRGGIKDKMLKIIDHYVYGLAERYAAGSAYQNPDLNSAHKVTERFASDEEVQDRMNSSLDKFVFRIAERTASGTSYVTANPRLARQYIDNFASRPGRRDAMLHQLGFM